VVESARCERDAPQLRPGRRDDLGMIVALVEGGVSREEVEVAPALAVPDEGSLRAGDHDRERMIVVGAEALRQRDGARAPRAALHEGFSSGRPSSRRSPSPSRKAPGKSDVHEAPCPPSSLAETLETRMKPVRTREKSTNGPPWNTR